MRAWKRLMAAALVAAMACAPASAAASAAGVAGSGAGDAAAGSTSAATGGVETVYEDPDYEVDRDVSGSGLIGAAFVNNEYFENGFELPVKGATGWGVCDLNVREGDDVKSRRVTVVKAGAAFEILEEGDKYLRVELSDGRQGWVSKAYAMINLPDVLPSAVYNAVNSDAAVFRSQGKELSGVTGRALYDVSRENARLGRAEYDMPVLYSTAVKIAAAQRAALVNGDTLVICETYRPMSAQRAVVAAMRELMKSDAAVREDVNSRGVSWFIATGISNHQRGYAVDVSLARVQDVESLTCGHYTMNVPGAVVEYEMPTAMHELSTRAAALVKPVSSLSETGWRSVDAAGSMTEGALALRTYMTDAGMTPLASEWWHFNDLAARRATGGAGRGGFELGANVSRAYDVEIELPMVADYVYVTESRDEDELPMMVVPDGARGLAS